MNKNRRLFYGLGAAMLVAFAGFAFSAFKETLTPYVSFAEARAVDRTYVRAAATQEAAAEVLGLPFSTYRRHLAAGVERLTERLWHWELRGAPPLPEEDPSRE